MDEDKPFSVYKHTSPNGKVYIGITKMIPEKRWLGGHGYRYNSEFYAAIKEFGWENIRHEIIATNLSVAEACSIESQLIREYDSCNPEKGYNHSDGGGYKYVHYSDSGIKDQLLQLKIQIDPASSQPILEMCKGLYEMKQKKLYRSFGFGTFEEYCEKRIGITRRQGQKYAAISLLSENEKLIYRFDKIGIEKLYILANLDEEQRTQIIDAVDIENISVKQLQAKIDGLNNNI